MTLTYKIQEAMEWQRELEALYTGVPQRDIALSRFESSRRRDS
jgi:hypothetical protein